MGRLVGVAWGGAFLAATAVWGGWGAVLVLVAMAGWAGWLWRRNRQPVFRRVRR